MTTPILRVVLVTGLSGAGKSSAMRAFEDLGFEAIDNLPVRLLPALLNNLEPPTLALAPQPAMVIGIDARTRGFVVEDLADLMGELKARPDINAQLLYLDCDDDALVRRYTETRRRHPLAKDRPAIDGIRQERRLLSPLRALADEIVDTTLLAPADLKQRLAQEYGGTGSRLTVSLISFAYRFGLPREADLVFDVRFLDNPHWVPDLRPLSGLDAPVGAHVAKDPRFGPFMAKISDLLLSLFDAYLVEGKSYLTIAIGCTGGRHRSVFVVERLHQILTDANWQVAATHRDLGR
jgi:UPF0042 nucleotide-binding protein